MNVASLRIPPRRNPRRFCNFHTLVFPAFATHRPASTYALFTKHPGVYPQFHPTTEDQNETATQHFPVSPVLPHIHPSGRRCRFPVLSDALFCVHHIHSQVAATPIPDVDLSRHFGPDPLNLRSACEINDFLCSLAILMIENRTPPVARRCSPTSPASNSARSRQSITNSAIPTKRSRASSSTAQRHSNPRSEIESNEIFPATPRANPFQ